MDVFKFSVSASGNGAVNLIQQPGTYVYYRQATAGIDNAEIKVKTDQGEVCRLLPGEGYTFDSPFLSFTVENYSAVATITGYLLASRGQFQANRLTGEVSVIDGARSRTMSGAAFSAYASVGAVSAKYGHALLLNPAGSGKRVIVDSSTYDIATADGAILIGTYSTALGNAGNAALNKYVKASPGAAVALVSYDFLSAGLTFGNQEVRSLKAYTPYLRKHTKPTILAPGYGIGVQHLTANQALAVYWEFDEESDT